ncbi:MAG: hypothetical protein PHO32_07275, partial [Candidatus Cloacimonetes bacterium]|nr:hypothetical protein [Candidatus Cloacimonadota bacterium]
MNRKTMLLLFAALTLLVSSLTATDGRMIALGNPFGFIRDNTDISAFPGAINRYNRNVVAELNSPGSSYYWTLGANLPVMNNVLGVYLNTTTGVSVDNAFGNTYPHYNIGDLDISKKIQFYFGFLEQFGVGFGMAIDSQKADNSDNPNQYVEQAATYFDVSGGMSTDMMDFGAKLMIAGAGTEADVDTETSLVGALGLETSGRYYIMDTDQFSLMGVASLTFNAEVTEAELEYTDAQNNVSLTTYTKESGAFMFDFGVGANYKIADNHTV